MEQYSDGTLTIIKDGDTFAFSCCQCGNCCRNRNDIILNPFDVYRAANHLQITADEFIEKYGEIYIGPDSGLPILSLRFREGALGETVCPFLKRKDGKTYCKIQQAKPFVCAAFPLGRLGDLGAGELQYFMQPDACNGGEPKKYTLKSWFEEYGLYGTDETSVEFNKLIETLLRMINLKALSASKKVSDKVKAAYLNFLFHKLYVDLFDGEDFLAKFKGNASEIIEKTKITIESLRGLDPSIVNKRK